MQAYLVVLIFYILVGSFVLIYLKYGQFQKKKKLKTATAFVSDVSFLLCEDIPAGHVSVVLVVIFLEDCSVFFPQVLQGVYL